MTEEEYAALPGVRWSHLREMEKSPLHYRWATIHGKPDHDGLRLGLGIHCALLESEEFAKRYVCFTGKTRRGKKWDAFKEAHRPPTKILTRTQMDNVIQSASAVRRHGQAESLLRGTTEFQVSWTEVTSGLQCKARVDLVGESHVEVKSTADLGLRSFASRSANMGYHRQLAFHHDALLANGVIKPGTPIYVIAVEQTAPYDVVVFELDRAAIEAGRADYQAYLSRVVSCSKSPGTTWLGDRTVQGRWPGREPSEILPLGLPEWMLGSSELSLDGEDVF